MTRNKSKYTTYTNYYKDVIYISGRLPSILLFFIFWWWHDLWRCFQFKPLSSKFCHSIGLLPYESIAKPYLDHVAATLPYMDVVVCWDISLVAPRLCRLFAEGRGKFIAQLIVPYIAGPLFHVCQNQFSCHPIDLLLVINRRPFWAIALYWGAIS